MNSKFTFKRFFKLFLALLGIISPVSAITSCQPESYYAPLAYGPAPAPEYGVIAPAYPISLSPECTGCKFENGKIKDITDPENWSVKFRIGNDIPEIKTVFIWINETKIDESQRSTLLIQFDPLQGTDSPDEKYTTGDGHYIDFSEHPFKAEQEYLFTISAIPGSSFATEYTIQEFNFDDFGYPDFY